MYHKQCIWNFWFPLFIKRHFTFSLSSIQKVQPFESLIITASILDRLTSWTVWAGSGHPQRVGPTWTVCLRCLGAVFPVGTLSTGILFGCGPESIRTVGLQGGSLGTVLPSGAVGTGDHWWKKIVFIIYLKEISHNRRAFNYIKETLGLCNVRISV